MTSPVKRGVDPYADADYLAAVLANARKVCIPFVIPQTELLAGTSIELVSPVAGVIETLFTTVQTAVTTGGAITVEVNTVLVAGLSVTVPDAAAAGSRLSDTPTADTPTARVAAGDRIEIIPAAAFATAGAVNGVLVILAD